MQAIDEFTAHLWARHGTACPICQSDGLGYPMPLLLQRTGEQLAKELACPVHGPVFSVARAA